LFESHFWYNEQFSSRSNAFLSVVCEEGAHMVSDHPAGGLPHVSLLSAQERQRYRGTAVHMQADAKPWPLQSCLGRPTEEGVWNGFPGKYFSSLMLTSCQINSTCPDGILQDLYKTVMKESAPLRYWGVYTDGGCDENYLSYWVCPDFDRHCRCASRWIISLCRTTGNPIAVSSAKTSTA